jgi:prepilin-type N-terminal cleavage/methylation domain-containing protein
LLGRYSRSQDGYTLIEVVVACAIGAVLMGALTSVILTSVRAGSTATSRIEASGQIRNFEMRAYDDFAGSMVPADASTCSPPPAACSIVLSGTPWSNSPTPTPGPYQASYVKYVWNGTVGSPLDRQVGGITEHIASSVSAFSWSLAGMGPNRTVVVNLTVIVQLYGTGQSYSESQTLRFYPRVNP